MTISLAHEWEETQTELTVRVRLGLAPRKGLQVDGAPGGPRNWAAGPRLKRRGSE